MALGGCRWSTVTRAVKLGLPQVHAISSPGMVPILTRVLSMQELPESHGAQLLESQFLCLQGHSQIRATYLNPNGHLIHLQNQN